MVNFIRMFLTPPRENYEQVEPRIEEKEKTPESVSNTKSIVFFILVITPLLTKLVTVNLVNIPPVGVPLGIMVKLISGGSL